MASRVFAILAAVFLVVAVGSAALTPLNLSLGTALLQIDRGLLDWVRLNSSPWLWASIETPVLLRPLWLVPAALGIVFAGIATTLNSRKTSARPRRRS